MSKVQLLKEKIEKKYQKEVDLLPQEILEIFLPYAKDPEKFQKLSDNELENFYRKWIKETANRLKREISSESELGELDID